MLGTPTLGDTSLFHSSPDRADPRLISARALRPYYQLNRHLIVKSTALKFNYQQDCHLSTGEKLGTTAPGFFKHSYKAICEYCMLKSSTARVHKSCNSSLQFQELIYGVSPLDMLHSPPWSALKTLHVAFFVCCLHGTMLPCVFFFPPLHST